MDAHDWELVEAVLNRCGRIHVPHDFGVELALAVRDVFFYNEARVYFLDEDACIFDQYLIGVSRKIVREYHEHYADTDDGAYSTTRRAREGSRIHASDERLRYMPRVMDWACEPHDTRFYREHVARQKIRWCTGVSLSDMNNRIRVLYTFDRYATTSAPTAHELELLEIIVRHLDAMYRNFYVVPPVARGNSVALEASGLALTPREVEIGQLLLNGLSPKSVARILKISRDTVYKHISNMHAKLGVSNQSELLFCLSAAIRS